MYDIPDALMASHGLITPTRWIGWGSEEGVFAIASIGFLNLQPNVSDLSWGVCARSTLSMIYQIHLWTVLIWFTGQECTFLFYFTSVFIPAQVGFLLQYHSSNHQWTLETNKQSHQVFLSAKSLQTRWIEWRENEMELHCIRAHLWMHHLCTAHCISSQSGRTTQSAVCTLRWSSLRWGDGSRSKEQM